MLGNIKEVRYGYVIHFREHSKEKMKLEMPLASELSNIYATKEECLEQAKEILFQFGYEKGFVYILPVWEKDIKIENSIIEKIVYIINTNNAEYIFNEGVYSDEKLQHIIENYFNEKNDWNYIEIIFDDIEVYKVHIERQIKNISVDKINLT